VKASRSAIFQHAPLLGFPQREDHVDNDYLRTVDREAVSAAHGSLLVGAIGAVRVQCLLNAADWDANAVRDDLISFVTASLGVESSLPTRNIVSAS